MNPARVGRGTHPAPNQILNIPSEQPRKDRTPPIAGCSRSSETIPNFIYLYTSRRSTSLCGNCRISGRAHPPDEADRHGYSVTYEIADPHDYRANNTAAAHLCWDLNINLIEGDTTTSLPRYSSRLATDEHFKRHRSHIAAGSRQSLIVRNLVQVHWPRTRHISPGSGALAGNATQSSASVDNCISSASLTEGFFLGPHDGERAVCPL